MMQLKLKIGIGESLTIDVQPEDTFQDLSDRLYQLAGVQVDLSQLKSDDKPFDMNTNVVRYFTPKIEREADNVKKAPKLCRLCCRAINHDPHFLFEKESSLDSITLADKVNASLPIHVTSRDQLPKQICSLCLKGLNSNYEFVKKVIQAQRSLENVFSVKARSPLTNDSTCPLCIIGKFKELDTVNGTVSFTKPDSSTQNDESSHCKPNLKKENNNKPLNVDTSVREYYYDDEVVTGYWDGTVHSSSCQPASKRYKKKTKADDDSEWTIDEEYLPVSRRGRPKGTKNKPKPVNTLVPAVVEKSCALCGWLGPEPDMLHHSLNHHCQPDMAYFPCPLCKNTQANELMLEDHLNRHSTLFSSSSSSVFVS